MDPTLTQPIQDLADDVTGKNSGWLDQPHPDLGLATPRSFIGTDQEHLVRDILRAAAFGVFS